MSKSSGSNKHWQLIFDWRVRDIDLQRLNPGYKRRVSQIIKSRLLVDPFLYGLPLRGKLKKYWKLRFGDWHIIYNVADNKIKIYAIGNRRDVYEIAIGRII